MRKNVKKIAIGMTLSMVLALGVVQPMFVEASASTSVTENNAKEQDATSGATELANKKGESSGKIESVKKSKKTKSQSMQGKVDKTEIRAKIKELEDKVERVKKNSKIPEFGKKKALKELKKQIKELKAQLKK